MPLWISSQLGSQIFPLFDIVDQLACGVIAACAFEAVGEHGVIVVLAEWLAPPEPHSQKARPVKLPLDSPVAAHRSSTVVAA